MYIQRVSSIGTSNLIIYYLMVKVKFKIADFGVSRIVKNIEDKMNEQCGTPAYIAPEILRDNGYYGFG